MVGCQLARALCELLEHVCDGLETTTLAPGGLIEAKDRVPAGVEGQIPAGDEHAQAFLGRALGSVAQHPDLRMNDAVTGCGHRHHTALEEGEHLPRWG